MYLGRAPETQSGLLGLPKRPTREASMCKAYTMTSILGQAAMCLAYLP